MSLQTRLAELITAVGADIKLAKAQSVWIAGFGPPTAATGKAGDFYVDLTSLNVYGPKVSKALASLTGLTGQLHPNPSLEANTTGWAITASGGGGTGANERTTDRATDGSYSYHGRLNRINIAGSGALITTALSGASAIPVSASLPYSFSFRLYTRTYQNATDGPGRARLYWFKADGTASSVPSSFQNDGDQTPLALGAWAEFSYENVVAPADAAFCRPTIFPGTSPASGEFIFEADIDSLVFVQATAVPKWQQAIGNIGTTGISLVTSLPGSPSDGQEVYYVADSSNNVIWHLRYRSATSKWEYVGGGSLYAEQLSNQASLNNSPNYTALASAVQVTAPVAGTYEVEYSVSASSSGTNTGLFTDVAVGSTAGSDQNAAIVYMNSSTFPRSATHKKRRITCAAGDVVALVHKAAVTTIITHARTLSLKPIAIA